MRPKYLARPVDKFRCAKCGVRTYALLWNRTLGAWFCHAHFNGPRYERRAAYWAEEYDEPVGGKRPAAYPVDTEARLDLYRKAGFTPGRKK